MLPKQSVHAYVCVRIEKLRLQILPTSCMHERAYHLNVLFKYITLHVICAGHAPPPAMPQSSGGGGFLSGLMGSVAQGEL